MSSGDQWVPANEYKNVRVGGWLWLFLFGLCIIGPLVDLIACIVSPTPLNFLLFVSLLALRFWTALALYRITEDAISRVKNLMVTFFVVAIFNIIRAHILSPEKYDHTDLENLQRLGAQTLLSVALWSQYFRKSRRVLETYGRNL